MTATPVIVTVTCDWPHDTGDLWCRGCGEYLEYDPDAIDADPENAA